MLNRHFSASSFANDRIDYFNATVKILRTAETNPSLDKYFHLSIYNDNSAGDKKCVSSTDR